MRLHQIAPVVAAVLIGAAANATTVVPGASNPKLAGMPDDSTASGGDTAPAQSPVLFTEFAISAGQWLQFSATGQVDHCGGGCPGGTPDGMDDWNNLDENGISGITAPIDSLLGVFLGPSQPSLSGAPGTLEFIATGLGTDFLTLQPQLKQVFFIGDGSTSGGVVQQFQVPTGATRLFLATHDGFGWYNNSGAIEVGVSPVPEPAAWALGLVGLAVVWRRSLRRVAPRCAAALASRQRLA